MPSRVILLAILKGIWHLANQGEVSWFDFAEQFVRTAGLTNADLRPVPLENLLLAAPRPHYSVLSSMRGLLLPALNDAIVRFNHEAEQIYSD